MDQERNKQIRFASWVGIISNILLASLKIIIGFLAGSLAVIGDGIDSATDVLTFFITLIAARIMNKPPNCKYPYGYNRAEAVATKALSFVIFFAGAQLFFSSLIHIIQNEPREVPSEWAIYVILISFVGKAILAWYQFAVGKKQESKMLIANGKNMRNDILISASVLAGLIFTSILKLPVLDLITAMLVSLWIMKTAFGIIMETNRELIDDVEDTAIYYKIFDAVESVNGAHNPHRLRLRKHANLYVIALDIEVDANMSIKDGHQIAKNVEIRIREYLDNVYDVMVHTEPLGNIEREQYGLSREIIDNEK